MENLKKSFLVRGDNIIGALGDKNFSTAPIGTVLSFAGQTAPYGYLICNGASYKVADYPYLYAVIGNTYGGDAENFNVPNLVDKFVQGSNISGTEKEAGLPNITGQFGNESDSHAIFYDSTFGGAFKANKKAKLAGGGSSSGEWYAKALFDASRSNPIYGNSDTVQPPALTMVYIIKAFHTNEGQDEGLNDETIELINQEIEGKAPSVEVQEIEGGHSLTITDKNGEQTFDVLDGKDGKDGIDGVQINDSATNTTSVWSSNKTKSYVDSSKPSVTKIGLNKSVDTGWALKRGSKYDFGKLVLVSVYNSGGTNSALKVQTGIALIKGTYNTNPSTVEYSNVVSIPNTVSFEVSSSGTLIIKTSGLSGSDSAATYMFLN